MRRKDRIKREVADLCRVYTSPGERVDVLYRDLSVVDGKAASLLTFNAIGLTALAVWLATIEPNLLHLVLDGVFLLFLISCGLLLIPVRVYWSPSSHFDDAEKQVDELVSRRQRRTGFYTFAWWMSLAAIGVLVVVSTLHGYHTFYHSMGWCEAGCQHAEGTWGHALFR